MYFLMNIDRIVSKDVFFFSLFLLLGGAFIFGVGSKIVLNDAVEDGVSYSWGDIFPAGNTLLFFSIY